ncbi:MAG TPA: alpha/beta fold hydrolase [Pseudonocardia sp.]|jgi:3-oxoadipate enol-lactonase
MIDRALAVGEYRAVDLINVDLGRRLVGSLRPTRPSRSNASPPWAPDLPPGRMLSLPGRGEVFIRESHAGTGGVTVLLLHAWTLSLDVNYFGLMPGLAARHPFVGLDHRGHAGGLPINGPFTIADCADDVLAVLDELGLDRVVVCGYSLGGPVGMHLALAHPERVAGLVLAATALNYRQWWRDRILWRLVKAVGPLARLGLGSSISARYFGINRAETPALAERWPWLQRELLRTPFANAVAMGDAVTRYDLRGAVGSLAGIPSAVIVATRDGLCLPRWQRQLAEQISATTFTLDADHDVPVTRPEEFAAVMLDAIAHVQALAEQPR